MNQQSRALAFSQLHQKHNPVILYNIWDAGSALAVNIMARILISG